MNWELINEIVVDTPVEEIIITLPKKYRKICLYIDLCSETDTTYNINIKTDVDYERIAVLNSALPKTGIGKRSVIYLAEKVAEKNWMIMHSTAYNAQISGYSGAANAAFIRNGYLDKGILRLICETSGISIGSGTVVCYGIPE